MHNNPRSCFTLIELSIVIVVIGIIMGVTVQAIRIRDSIILDKVMIEAYKLRSAVNTFRERYQQWPGDMYNPEKYFVDNADNGDPVDTKGNGNGAYNLGEDILALQHLAFAGILEGDYDGSLSYSKLYKGPIKDSAFTIVDNIPGIGINKSILFYKVKYVNPAVNDNVVYIEPNGILPVLSVNDMQIIDNKYDTGDPNTGFIIPRDNPGSSNACVVLAGGKYEYANNTTKDQKCVFYLLFDKSL